MILGHVKASLKDREDYSYKDVFLVDKDGNLNQEMAAKYPDKSAWYKAHKEETKNLFADISPDYPSQPKTQEKVLEIAEKVFSKVTRTLDLYDPIPVMFPTVTNYSVGEKPEIHDVYGGRVYERSYGAFANISRLTQDVYSLKPYQFAIHIAEPLETLQSGRITVADVTNAIARGVLARRVRFGYDTYIAAYATGGSYATNESGSLEKANLDLVIRTVGKYAEANGITVFGAHSDIVQANDFNVASNMSHLYTEAQVADLHRRGIMSQYQGANLLSIKYWVDDRYAYQPFPAGSMFAITDAGDEWSQWAEWPDARSSWISEEDRVMHWMYVFEIGAAIHKVKYGWRLYGITNSYGA
jgi:hypothetical protein